jgi:hypothetical protein
MSIGIDIRERCDEADVDGNACDELREPADRIDREMAEKERLKRENAELTAEPDDWKGNAEGFQPYAYMKLPLDADGVPIRIGDTVYTRYAEEHIVRGIYALAGEYGISVVPPGGTCSLPMEPEELTHRTADPADSWEKLEEDAKKTTCDYAPAPRDEDGLRTCDGCRFEKCGPCHIEKAIDVINRAKKLAGIEEEAQR